MIRQGQGRGKGGRGGCQGWERDGCHKHARGMGADASPWRPNTHLMPLGMGGESMRYPVDGCSKPYGTRVIWLSVNVHISPQQMCWTGVIFVVWAIQIGTITFCHCGSPRICLTTVRVGAVEGGSVKHVAKYLERCASDSHAAPSVSRWDFAPRFSAGHPAPKTRSPGISAPKICCLVTEPDEGHSEFARNRWGRLMYSDRQKAACPNCPTPCYALIEEPTLGSIDRLHTFIYSHIPTERNAKW